jgi:hypothetical protein
MRCRVAIALALALVASVAHAQTPTVPKPWDQQTRAEKIARLEYWCSGRTALPQCVREIVRVDREIKKLDEMLRRTGQDANRGLSLMGCYNYCILRHFPFDTPGECKATVARFRRSAASNHGLMKTALKGHLDRTCKAVR